MGESSNALLVVTLILGIIIFLAIIIKSELSRFGIPSLVGFMALGFSLRIIDDYWIVLTQPGRNIFEFLAEIGVICLLFRVGLESNLPNLIKRLRPATAIWIGNILFSGVSGYLVARFLLKFGDIPSLFIAVALTATSVGVSIAGWQEVKAINSSNAELLLDIAEMDDISGILFMALLFAAVPHLKESIQDAIYPVLAKTLTVVLFKLFSFGVFCFLFSQYLEQRITNCCDRLEPSPDPMLSVTAIAIMIASLAGLLGFSVAIGAFFAGLVFSRDPNAIKIDASFDAIYDIFTPFFFFEIGYNISPHSFFAATGMGILLFVVAVLGKIFGTGLPAWPIKDLHSAVVLGVSMIPRAEIAMVVMQKGLTMPGGGVPENAFSAMAMVSLMTCIIAPIVLRWLFTIWPDTKEKK